MKPTYEAPEMEFLPLADVIATSLRPPFIDGDDLFEEEI